MLEGPDFDQSVATRTRCSFQRVGRSTPPINCHQQALQSGSIERSTLYPDTVIVLRQQYPTLGLLVGHIGCTGFTLRTQRVEFLRQRYFETYSGIDSAANFFHFNLRFRSRRKILTLTSWSRRSVGNRRERAISVPVQQKALRNKGKLIGSAVPFTNQMCAGF